MRTLLGRSLAVAALLALPLLVSGGSTVLGQTAAPPPPAEPVIAAAAGTTIVDTTYPAIAPPGVPPVVGNGALAIVPSVPDDAVGSVNADLGGGFQATALVPTDPTTTLAVRVASLDPALAPEATLAISVDIYDAATGTLVDRPLSLGIRAPDGVDPATVSVALVDPVTGVAQLLTTTVDPETGVIGVEIP